MCQNYHLMERVDIVLCTHSPKLGNSLLSFSELINTAKFCRQKNLTLLQEILIGERKIDGLSFKGSLVAEIWAPELLTLMLTLPPMENELVDYTHIGYCQNNF